jgi:excisionase family DNA binding protein
MTTHTPESSARDYVKASEAAAYLNCSVRAVMYMISDGRLKAYKLGPRFMRLDRNEVVAAMQPVIPCGRARMEPLND